MKLKKPYDIRRLASTMSVAKGFNVGYSTLISWLNSGAPRPETLRAISGRRLMLWSEKDISNFRRWMIDKKKTFSENRAVVLERLIRRHSLQIEVELEKELAGTERKPEDALVLVVRGINEGLQKQNIKTSPEHISQVLADALLQQIEPSMRTSPELVGAFAERLLSSVVAGTGRLN